MTIEDGVPIPPAKRGNGGRPVTETGEEVRKMKIGQSKLFATEGQCNTARSLIYRLGGKCESRKMTDGWRVWRTA